MTDKRVTPPPLTPSQVGDSRSPHETNSSAARQEAQPVAWRWRYAAIKRDSTPDTPPSLWHYEEEPWERQLPGIDYEPLYAAPAPEQD